MPTTFPSEVLDLGFRAFIEGNMYKRPTTYVGFKPPVAFREQMQVFEQKAYSILGGLPVTATKDVLALLECEWVVIQRNYQSYPSGGESYYASYVYWNGNKLEVADGNGTIRWMDVDFYRIERSDQEKYMPSPVQQVEAWDCITYYIDVLYSCPGQRPQDHTKKAQLILAKERMQDGVATEEEWWQWVYKYGSYMKQK